MAKTGRSRALLKLYEDMLSMATLIARFSLAVAILTGALLLASACTDDIRSPLGEKPTATPENQALKIYIQRAQSVMDRRTETQGAADEAIGALKVAVESGLTKPQRPMPVTLSSLTSEQIQEALSKRPPLSEAGQQMLTDTVAELGLVVGRAEVEEADLRQLEVPVEAQRVHDLLTASLSTESMAWNALLNHCVQVLNREADWDQSQVDSAERLLLQARVDRLEAELELRDLVRTSSATSYRVWVQPLGGSAFMDRGYVSTDKLPLR